MLSALLTSEASYHLSIVQVALTSFLCLSLCGDVRQPLLYICTSNVHQGRLKGAVDLGFGIANLPASFAQPLYNAWRDGGSKRQADEDQGLVHGVRKC
jgi:hypothetical protein